MLHHAVVIALEGRIEFVADKRRLATAAHTRHNRHHSQRELHTDTLQVVLTGILHLYVVMPTATRTRNRNDFLTRQVFQGEGLRRSGLQRGHVTQVSSIDNISTVSACQWTNVNDVIRRLDDFLIMLNDNNRITQGLQFSQYLDETLRVSRMKPDTRLVKDIQ